MLQFHSRYSLIDDRTISFSGCRETNFSLKNRISKFIFLFFLTLTSLLSYSQGTGKKIELLNAEKLKSAKDIADGAIRYIGNVKFKQENTFMFCDSAYLYKNNSLDAFGHVHIQQNDSVNLYGDLLKYNGNAKKAVLTKNVILTKTDMQLTTDVLNYDMNSHIGYYTTPARIVSKENVLTSDQGYYFSKTNDLNFKKNVVLINPQFIINCDTMRYNTISKITYFLGPTTIKSKENLIYCEDGWYDTDKDLSRFSKNSYIITNDKKMLGDSLYYDRKNGIGRAYKNVHIIDTAQNINISGDFAIHHELEALSIVTGHALLTQLFEEDTLYMHADTLEAVGDSKNTRLKTDVEKQNDKQLTTTNNDSTNKDSTINQQLFAFHHVKFFKKDLQGKCDSLVYTISDSVMKLFDTPTLWSEENQLTGDTIKITTGSKSLKTIELKTNAFIISQQDSIRFNQIRGKYMKGFFAENKLARVNVEGNGQTIYFVKERDKKTKEEHIKAVNRADCSDLHIYLTNNEVQKITFITKPDATLFPLNQVDVKELKLKDFIWRSTDRPASAKDIFVW